MYLLRPNYPKLKTTLQLAIFKVKLLQRNISAQNAKTKREVADLILKEKIHRAKFKVELIISESYYIDVLENVEIYCNLLLEQFHLISEQKEIDDLLKEAISTIIWVSSRLSQDVQELTVISNILCGKYGPNFAKDCKEGHHEAINSNIKRKLGVSIPSKLLIENYMAEIARNYNISYIPDPTVTGTESEEEIVLPDTQPRQFDFSIKRGSDFSNTYPSTSSPFSSYLLPEEEVEEGRTSLDHDVPVPNNLQENHEHIITSDLTSDVEHSLSTEPKNLPRNKEKQQNKDLPSAKQCHLPQVPTEQPNDPLEGKSLSTEIYGITNVPKEQDCGLPKLSPVTVKRPRSLSADDLLTTFKHTDKEKDSLTPKRDTGRETQDKNKDIIHQKTTNQNLLKTDTSNGLHFINNNETSKSSEKHIDMSLLQLQQLTTSTVSSNTNTIFPPLSLTKQSLKLSMSTSNIFQPCSNIFESVKESEMYGTTHVKAIKSKLNDDNLTHILNIYNQKMDVLELPCTSKDTSLLLIQNISNEDSGTFQKLREDVDISLPSTSAYLLDDSLDKMINLPDVPDDEIYIFPQLPSVPDVDTNKLDNNKDIGFDELCKRFYALKRKDQ
ncbi:unnamed protein product [Diabrotica balteata]|uniref:IST1 homolog n=1 Tax=Diabrotica balteata TaxID=107213 RepID=A0A9N9TF19_DIABA|nr:unnamed protein product [Diabrotica balteata]